MGAPKGLHNYRDIKDLGVGASGSVTLVECMNGENKGQQFALKKISLAELDPKKKRYAENEVQLLKVLICPTIIRYYESFSSKDWIWIAMEYADGGSLNSYIKGLRTANKRIPLDVILDWTAQISLGIMVMHNKKILHRDIKTDNILLVSTKNKDKPVVKIGDFGVSKALNSSDEKATTLIGTPYFMAPEVAKCEPYNHKSDMWSLGCVIYQMATFNFPFDGKSVEALKEAIKYEDFTPFPPDVDPEIQKLIASLLIKDPEKRLSIWEFSKYPVISARIRKFVDEYNCYDLVADVLLANTALYYSSKSFIEEDIKATSIYTADK